MIRLLIVIGVAIVVAAVLWNLASGKESLNLGFGPSAPVGDAVKVEEHLVAKGFRKVDFTDKEGLRIFFGERFQGADVTATEYADAVPGMKHFVLAVRGKDGKLLGVCCRFRSAAKEFSLVGTRTEHFTALMWLHIAGAPPKFEARNESGADARDYWLATVSKAGAACSWRKEGAGGPKVMTHEIHDTVVFVRE